MSWEGSQVIARRVHEYNAQTIPQIDTARTKRTVSGWKLDPAKFNANLTSEATMPSIFRTGRTIILRAALAGILLV